MAQKAAKTLAANNTKRLNITAVATLIVHTFFWLLRGLIFRKSFRTGSLYRYLLLSAPALIIHFFFERNSRPTFGPNGEVKRAGDDLDAKGLTEWMWDIVYWTYGCIVLVSLLGDWAWWLWLVIPVYSAYLAYTTFVAARGGMAGMTGAGADGATSNGQGGASKRQAKMEKRGGQKVQYR